MGIKHLLVLFIIIAIAVVLRAYNPLTAPPSLNWDEASLGYNAYSVLQTGRDEWGRVLPLTFEAFGDFKLPVFIYTLIPFIAIFGLSDWVIRLPSVIGGILSVPFVYLIALKLTGRKQTALFAAFLLAISATHIFFSRIALEANLALALFLGSMALLLIGLERPNKGKILFIPLSFLLLGFSLFTYNSARIFVPFFLTIVLVIYRKSFFSNFRLGVLSLIIFIIFICIAGYLAVFVDSSSRYFWVSIVDQGAIDYLNEARGNSTLPVIATKILYNKYVYFILAAAGNYLQHFSSTYLLLQGGKHSQFSMPNQGIMYFTEAALFLIGMYALIKTGLKKQSTYILLAWLFIAPIPAAITREAPHVLRSIFMIGAIQIIAAVGFDFLFLKARQLRKFLVLILLGILLFEVGKFSNAYFFNYSKSYSQSWQYGMKEAVTYIQKSSEGRAVLMTKRYGEPHIFYLFYSSYSPLRYQQNPNLVRYDRTYWRWVDRLDDIYFINDWEIKDKTSEVSNALVITTPGNFAKGELIDSIYFLDGSKAFDIVDIGGNYAKR